MTNLSQLETYVAARAQQSIDVFAEYVVRDERSGAPIQLANHHRQMFAAMDRERRAVLIAPSEFGKSVCLATYVAWKIGRDPSLRVALLSATREQATRLLRLSGIIMNSPRYQRVFPGIAVDRQTADEISVSGRPSTAKDVNILASAFDLSSMLGARIDLAACDDLISREALRTTAARDRSYQDFLAVTGSRVAPGGQVLVVGTSEHSDDLVHRLGRLPGWHSEAFPALDEHGRSVWPERWPTARIEQRRMELGPIGFQRAMMCQPVDAASLVFQPDEIEQALRNGADGNISPLGGRVVIGVDPAWTTSATSDESAIVMVTIDDEGYRHVVQVEGHRIHHDRLVERVVELALINRATVYVEANGAGGVIADLIGRRVPCRPLTTTATSKRARVEALSAELASGRWAFRQPLGTPSPELRKLIDELSTFSFETHCGDRASALLLACEAARTMERRPKVGWLHLPDRRL